MEEKLIGKVTHYFDKAMVVVVLLSDKIQVGDKIKVKHGENEIEQVVDSMQIEHKNIEKAEAGQEIAIKVSGATKEGAEVFKVTE